MGMTSLSSIPAAAALLVALAAPACAQTWFAQNAPGRAPAAQPPAARPAAPAPTEEQRQRVETVVFGGWTVTCREIPGGDAKKTCSAQFQAMDQNRQQVILSWIMGRTADGKLASVLQTPTGVQLAKGVQLKFGEGTPRKLDYVVCETRCEAMIVMDERFVREASAAQTATATIVAKAGQSINITMPLAGFDKAAAELGRP
jgi:invasion protein IalB